MDYHRVTPKAREGTTGISVEYELNANETAWISPPDRVSAITVAVHIPTGAEASYKIQATCNRPETIGNGTGGYWDNVDEAQENYTANKVLMIANAITGLRVVCDSITENNTLNVCFVG